MRFTIFTKIGDLLIPHYEINRTEMDLYINSVNSKREHFSYHKSGASGHKSNISKKHPDMRVEKSRPPLTDFRGSESIITLNVISGNLPSSNTGTPKQGDMVFEIKPPIAMEIIISENDIKLPVLADRITVDVQKNMDMKPIIIVEAYNLINNTLCIERFRRIHPLKFGR